MMSSWWCCRALEWFVEDQNLACGILVLFILLFRFTLKTCPTLLTNLHSWNPLNSSSLQHETHPVYLYNISAHPQITEMLFIYYIFSYTLTFKGNFPLRQLDHCPSKSTHNHLQLQSLPLEPLVYKYLLAHLTLGTGSCYALSSY